MDPKEQLKDIINSSTLTDGDKGIWNHFSEVATDIQVGMVYDFLKNNPEEISFMTNNFKAKLEALSQNDQAKMEEIKKSEEVYLKKYQ